MNFKRSDAELKIRKAAWQDFAAIWPILKTIVTQCDTYAFDPEMSRDDGYAIWMSQPEVTYVAESGGKIVGSYYLKANFSGPGGHVCNCGYIVDESSRGQGVASALCEHSQKVARDLDYKAMQFNSVVSTNEGAIRLWQKHGFGIIGTVPSAFQHREQGLVDSCIMYKWLEPIEAEEVVEE